ncbi:MAG: hypothetical protein BWX64_01589 [Acidobacteria bacterium ADurb.Bin051]|nr:MAG: hypothetical protein BWX64_01589 [Acidobacteria bacterium ADurb.Bin051]
MRCPKCGRIEPPPINYNYENGVIDGEREVDEYRAEIAALREAVRWVYVKIDGAVWVADDLMDDAPISATDNPKEVAAILRALEEERR